MLHTILNIIKLYILIDNQLIYFNIYLNLKIERDIHIVNKWVEEIALHFNKLPIYSTGHRMVLPFFLFKKRPVRVIKK